ncbi:MAG: APC family permease [Candidatus Micrarchaeia archaeon]
MLGKNSKKSEVGVFVRESTGLVKNVSFLDSISLNIGDMSAGAALATIGFTTILFSSMVGINLVYASLLAFVLSIPQIIVYTIMNRKVHRTGGDYIWTSRIFGGLFGGSLAFMGYSLETLAYLALIALSTVFAIGSVGVALGNMSFLGLALPGNTSGAEPFMQFVVASVIFVVLIAVNIFKPKIGYKLVTISILLGILILLLSVGVLLIAGKSGVESYINSLSTQGLNETYTQIASSYKGSNFNFMATLLMLPFFAIFVYPWINAAPGVASEIKSRKGIRWAIPVSSIIVLILVTGGFASMYIAGGYHFINAALSNPTLVYDYSFNFWTLAMGVSKSPLLSLVIGIGWILWDIAILAYGIIVFSRYIFAQAFDRFLPEKLAYISKRYGSPVAAHLFDLVVTIFLIAGAAFLYGPFSSLYGAVAAAMIYFIFIGIAATIYALRYLAGSEKATLVVSGILMAIVFLFITYQFFAYPKIWGGNALAYGYVVASFVAGIVLYEISKWRNAKKGIDISMAFKEIPPE